MDVYRILGLEPGDAHVIRNAGGVVTQDTLRSLAISQHVLGTREVLLVHHTRGGMEGAEETAVLDALPWSHPRPTGGGGRYVALGIGVLSGWRTGPRAR